MLLEYQDFNGAEGVIASRYSARWQELVNAIMSMPLHLKASDQRGLQGTPIFDVVGTNSYLEERLVSLSWESHIPIPSEYTFLGKDVDFGKDGSILEVQFSNYPFLLNNLLRSELFYKSEIKMAEKPVGLLLIVTKSGMFPASNSTLYYERAYEQISALSEYSVFDVPIRLVGLFESRESTVEATWTKYTGSRYSRTVLSQEQRKVRILSRLRTLRCDLNFV